MQELTIEKEKLKQTLKTVEQVLEEEINNLEKLYDDFDGEMEFLWDIANKKKIHITNLKTALNKPYFARIDFTAEDDGKINSIYIGKNGIMKNNSIVVTDWRAPISSLYYDAEVGKCSYEAPDGSISGDMSLKRQYEIEKGELLEYFDVDLVSNDELLQKYLNTNNDARLKSIVATIQKEQNEVIRKRLADNLIIQGVAGSGKTTVALHRIAYLVYNYIKSIKQNQYLVIGPNPVFIKYIKSVLPELDVDGVSQCTFEQFAQDYIGEEISINSSDKKVVASISGKNKNNIDKFKCSMKYKEMVDKFLQVYFNSLVCKDLKIGNFTILSSEVIKEIFLSTDDEYTTNLSNRVEKTIDLLSKYIEMNKDEIMDRYSKYSYEKFNTATTEEEKQTMRKEFSKERSELSKNCKSLLRRYFSRSKIDCIKLYKVFINSINDFNIHNYEHLNTLKNQTSVNIKNNSYDFEDLAALLYIKQSISPNKEYKDIKHVIVDEAQDLGEFNFFILKEILPLSTFSIFGDIAQSIYDYRGIDNWEQVNDIMFDNKGEIINFNKSYRTTSEIMNVADDVSNSIGLGRSDLVVREGSPVEFTKLDDNEKIPSYIINKIREYKEKGYKTIAVISKTNLLSSYINDDLSFEGLFVPNVSINDDLSDEKFQVCTISNQLAKGLEFDAVIINNASEDIYCSNNKLDMKLLYVAITRALHELDIVYTGELTKPLQNSLSKNAQKTLRK